MSFHCSPVKNEDLSLNAVFFWILGCYEIKLYVLYCFTHAKISQLFNCRQQDVFATGLWQAWQQVVTTLLFYLVATRLSLTTC
jgi:hypothetical protein